MYHLMFKKRSQARKTARPEGCSGKPAPMGIPKAAFWITLGLILGSLFGCSTAKVVRELPPQDLLANCPAVVEQVTTNGALVSTILDYRASISTCNLDKESLREWAKRK